jgi:hypothetical protein
MIGPGAKAVSNARAAASVRLGSDAASEMKLAMDTISTIHRMTQFYYGGYCDHRGDG